MTESLRPARLDWSQGQPASADFGDIYFSSSGGDAETRHVFLDGNQLAERFAALAPAQPFTLLETGFGTGLNWLCTQALRRETGHKGWLHYVSIEKHPLQREDLQRAQDCWPAFATFAHALQAAYPALTPGFHRLLFPQWQSTLTLVFADVQDALPRLAAHADAWFLDGFAPSRNPAMWTPALYAQMARLSKPGASFATFTAAGAVRRGLEAAGFSVRKTAGFGKKREMLRGEFAGASTKFSGASTTAAGKPWLARPACTASAEERTALVIGAGIAGASTAQALALRGWKVTVLEAGPIAGAASGNPAAVVSLSPAADGEALDHFPQQASLHALRQLNGEAAAKKCWHACGVLELPAKNRRKDFAGERRCALPETLWQAVTAEQAGTLAGTAITSPAIWQPQSGWLDAAAWCRELLAHPAIRVQENCKVQYLEDSATGWRARDAHGDLLAQAPVLIIANSHAARHFQQSAHLPLRPVRGQISLLPATSASQALQAVVCARGYVTPALASGQHCLGASFVPDDEALDIRDSEHAENHAELHAMLPELASTLTACSAWQGRSSLRCQSPDYLPLVGPLAAPEKMATDYAGLKHGKLQDYPALTTLPGLYVHLGQGSHGFSQAALAAEILASDIAAEPAPVSQKTLDSLHPCRFFIRALKRGKT